MTRSHISIVNLVYLAIMTIATSASAQTSELNLLGEFSSDWKKSWIERKISEKPTLYEVVEQDTNKVLRASSINESSALWHSLELYPGRIGTISWKWKVDKLLSDDINEKSKKGDDYAARVIVVFEPHLVSWKTRAICYVWAAKEPVGTIFRNPYAQSVAMVVVQSGKENKGKWLSEERNFVSDYRKAFDGHPEMVSAVAIMVDTDNTNHEAVTWFDDIKIMVSDASEEKTDEQPRGIILNN